MVALVIIIEHLRHVYNPCECLLFPIQISTIAILPMLIFTFE